MVTANIRRAKLRELVSEGGFGSISDALAVWSFDSVVDGICVNPGCDYATEVEPDCADGHCEACNTSTVQSGLVLAGII